MGRFIRGLVKVRRMEAWLLADARRWVGPTAWWTDADARRWGVRGLDVDAAVASVDAAFAATFGGA